MRDTNRVQTALDMFTLARNEQRVHILELLGEVTLPVDCRDLAEQIHSRSGVTADSRMEIEQALHHNHLPALDDGGILSYDRRERRVTEFDAERLSTLVEATAEVVEELPSE